MTWVTCKCCIPANQRMRCLESTTPQHVSYRISLNRPRPSNRPRPRIHCTGCNNVHVYTVVTTNLHTLRWNLFVQPVLIRNIARPRIHRALDYSVQFGQAEINRPRAVYSRKYGMSLCTIIIVFQQQYSGTSLIRTPLGQKKVS